MIGLARLRTKGYVVFAVVTMLAVTVSAATAAPLRTRGNAPPLPPNVRGSLVVIIGYEPASLDPAVDYDTGGDTYLGNVYEGLVQAVGERTVRIIPWLATSWSESPNGKVWTFHLRKNVHFHDGSVMDARAVKFSFDRLLAGKHGAYSDYAEIQGVDVVNPLTVRFRLQYPFASFLASLSNLYGPSVVSPKTVGNHKIAANGASYLDSHDAGTGPYMLQSYQHHQKIVLQAFSQYWRGWRGRHTARVVVEWPSSSSTQRLELERGGADATMNLSPQDFSAVSSNPNITVIERKAQTIRDIRLNTAKGALKNRLVRQALSYAFDYNGIVKGVFQGHAARMVGVGPTGFKNFVRESHLYTFDLNKAKALLKQAGYKSGDLSFQVSYLPEDQQSIQMAQIFQADLAKIGVKANLQGIPIATYTQVDQKPSTNPDIWFGQWTMDYADDAQLYWTDYYSKNTPANGGGNVFFYKDPTTDRFLMNGVRAKSAGAAYRNFAQACHRVYNDAVEIWATQPTERVALRKNIHGYSYNYLYSNYFYPLYSMYRS